MKMRRFSRSSVRIAISTLEGGVRRRRGNKHRPVVFKVPWSSFVYAIADLARLLSAVRSVTRWQTTDYFKRLTDRRTFIAFSE